MGFADRLKDLKKQAQEAVVEHKDQIQQAVDTVGVLANEKTGGKYANKISKIHDQATSAVGKVATDDGASETADAAATATSFDAQSEAVADTAPPSGEPPSFADTPSDAETPAAPETPPPGVNPSHAAPDFES
jgi:phage-related minor tail protein